MRENELAHLLLLRRALEDEPALNGSGHAVVIIRLISRVAEYAWMPHLPKMAGKFAAVK